MEKWIKKPVVVDAVRLSEAMLDQEDHMDRVPGAVYDQVNRVCRMKTASGVMLAAVGDWIVIAAPDQVFPVKDRTFRLLFEPLEMRLVGSGQNGQN